MSQDFFALMQLFTRHSSLNATLQDTFALAPWPSQLWLVDSECPLPPTEDVTPTEDLLIPAEDDLDFIAKIRVADFVSLAISMCWVYHGKR
jgi:hypothetical protein